MGNSNKPILIGYGFYLLGFFVFIFTTLDIKDLSLQYKDLWDIPLTASLPFVLAAVLSGIHAIFKRKWSRQLFSHIVAVLGFLGGILALLGTWFTINSVS